MQAYQRQPQAAPAQTTTQRSAVTPSEALEIVLNATPTEKHRAIDLALIKKVERIEEVLPPHLKGWGMRFVKTAMVYWSKNPGLEKCTPASFIAAVIDAASLGLCIDGRLCAAIAYNTKYKIDGRDEYRMEAKADPDWKGWVVIAKRAGLIKDAFAEPVHEADEFDFYRDEKGDHLHHKIDLRKPRGRIFAAYAKLILPDGSPHCELMGLDQIEAARSCSKQPNGLMWTKFYGEGARKTVMRRCLKYFREDATMMRALDLDELSNPEPVPTILETNGAPCSHPEASQPDTSSAGPPGDYPDQDAWESNEDTGEERPF